MMGEPIRNSPVKRSLVMLCLAVFVLGILVSGCTLRIGIELKYTVLGKVVTASGQPVAGVTLVFSSGFVSATTDGGGTWTKGGLQGAVTVTPVRDGWTFTPASRQLTGSDNNVTFVGAPVQ